MFEAELKQGQIIKMIIESMKDLVKEGNLDCSQSGISLQAMDSSHVSLITLLLRAEGFNQYRCDKPIALGLSLESLSKILKCSNNDDSMSLAAEDSGDILNMTFQAKKGDRISEFQLKLMDIDTEHLGIPDTEYLTTVRLPSATFQRICRDLNTMGDTCCIAVNKDGIKFSVAGDMGTGNITLKHNAETEKEDDRVLIQMDEPVELVFALRYLTQFTKATPLSGTVTLSMSPDVPVVIEYAIEEIGYIRYYLAPKIDDTA